MIRASRVHFVGKSENFYFDAYAEEPLWLVDKTDGRRMYFRDKIGKFVHAFDVVPPRNDAR